LTCMVGGPSVGYQLGTIGTNPGDALEAGALRRSADSEDHIPPGHVRQT
jgi:hypothetical protein